MGLDVDPIDRAVCSLLLADLADDRSAFEASLAQALDAVAEQRDLLGSAEMRATIARRVGPIREVAIPAALRADEPAAAVLDVLERTPHGSRGTERTSAAVLCRGGAPGALRDARVTLEEAKIGGADLSEAEARVRDLERDTLRQRRASLSLDRPLKPAGAGPVDRLPLDTAYATHTLHQGRLIGVVRARGRTQLVELGDLREIVPAIRTQRSALRRLADERRRQPVVELKRLRDATTELDARLIEPLGLGAADRVVLTVAVPLRDVTWSALPSLQGRPLTLAPTLGAWMSDVDRLRIRRLAFLRGPGLVDTGELDMIADIWGRPDAIVHHASCDQAVAMLRRADLVHIAAHGAFRTDNPFFSSLLFEDGPLSILDLSELDLVPAVVVLASCDAGSAATANGLEDVVVGTATELRHLGAHIVIAPSVAVNDAAAAVYSRLVHEGFAGGATVDEAVVHARNVMLGEGEPAEVAAAHAFHVFGGRATRMPFELPSAD